MYEEWQHFGKTRKLLPLSLHLVLYQKDLPSLSKTSLPKLVERIVTAQLRPCIYSNDLGNTFDSAYKAGHSTETALLCIQNERHMSLPKGCPRPCFAHFVSGASRFCHITPTLKSLHWLPVKQQIIFKILVLIHKYLTTRKLKYFAPFLSLCML